MDSPPDRTTHVHIIFFRNKLLHSGKYLMILFPEAQN